MLMKTIGSVGALCLVLTACQPKIDYVADGPMVSAQDFSAIAGDWVGTLTYTDYGSGELTVIRTRASVTSISDTDIKYTTFYPDEPWEDSKSTVKISNDGRLLDGHVILERIVGEDETLIVTTQYSGEDDNRPADILQTYGLSPTNFYIRKEVKFDDSKVYMLRNTYAFSRLLQ